MTDCFNASQSEEILALMPLLQFNLQHDSAWTNTHAVQAYLDFYRINFAKTQPGVFHGFGVVDVCNFCIATHYWLPENPRGTLIVLHGYYDHIGIFANAIAYGLKQGLAVLAFDLPGHGLSGGDRVAINSFDQYADVLEAVMMQSGDFFPRPLYGLGQSTGAAILLNHLWRYQQAKPESQRFHRLALLAPLILPRGWGMGRFVYFAVHPFVQRMRRGASRNSHDKSFIDFVDNRDHLQSKFLSVKWVGAMKAWNRKFRAFDSLPTKLLVIQGTNDLTVAWHYNMKMIRRKLSNADICFIEDAGHQLVNESDEYRTQVFTTISQYFFNN